MENGWGRSGKVGGADNGEWVAQTMDSGWRAEKGSGWRGEGRVGGAKKQCGWRREERVGAAEEGEWVWQRRESG